LERLDDTGAAIKRVVCALAEIRDAETGAHLRRMGVYARELARALPASVREAHRVDHAYVDRLHEAAPLHDIGKIGVPDQILLKRGPLTDDERCTMRQHSAIGRAILQTAGAQTESQSVPLLQVGMEICESHHERWDGAGYPHGIRGTEIPLSARIVAVADVYDALATSRPYRAEAFAHETVCEMIVEERGGAFDPDVVDAFIVCEASLGVISQGLFEEAFETVALPPITIETDSTSRGSAARVWETSAFVETARDLGLIS
jgi:putative two-component system response regulator